MAEDKIELEVVTPERAVLAEEVDEVVLPGEMGQVGILPGHLPLLTSLDIGQMLVRESGEERRFFVEKGFAEVLENKVSVLTQECEGVEDIDVAHAREELREAEREVERLEEEAGGEELEEELLERYRESLRKARTRLITAGEEVEE